MVAQQTTTTGGFVIVPQAEIELVNSKKRTAMLLPVEYGMEGERKPCPVEVGKLASLQPARSVKGTKVTITGITRGRVGEFSDAGAFCVSRGTYLEAWLVTFVLGNRTEFYKQHRERYLKRKGMSLTHDPELAIAGEPAVTEEEEIELARKARHARVLEERARAKVLRGVIKASLGELRGLELDKAVEKEIGRAERRLEQLDKALETNVPRAA
jgi:hypothetical protein